MVALVIPTFVFVLAAGALAAQPTTGARALTQADVALLVDTVNPPEMHAKLTEALASPQPLIRRVAARVARAAGSVATLPALERALAGEAPDTLTRTEIAHAIESLRGKRPEGEWASARPAIEAMPFNVRTRMRLWPPLTPTLARDLLRATGCALPWKTPFIVAQIDYGPTGAVNRGALEGELSDDCRRLGRVMVALTLAPPGRTIEAGEKELVMFGFAADYLDCLNGDARDVRAVETRPVRVAGSGMIPPQRIGSVNPVYPATSRDRRIQGAVIVEATISSRGCVQGLEVVRSVDPALDFAALSAVMLWRYLPGRLDDHKTPAIMNVLVNFSPQ
jgi:TonB family protein